MSGEATATFTCGVKSCACSLTTHLYNDGQYTQYYVPEQWHVQLGYQMTGSDTLVRCPRHCRWYPGIPGDLKSSPYWWDEPE